MTRTDEQPDVAALEAATRHSREACRLAPDTARRGRRSASSSIAPAAIVDALAASRRAVTLEPDNWRHHFRLAYVGWGEERLRAAHRTLALLPGFALAHWLIATVHVARHALGEADRELAMGIASQSARQPGRSRGSAPSRCTGCAASFTSRAATREAALEAFERELAFEDSGHLYGRECCANTWYAIGALRLHQGDRSGGGRTPFEQALDARRRAPTRADSGSRRWAIRRRRAASPGRPGVGRRRHRASGRTRARGQAQSRPRPRRRGIGRGSGRQRRMAPAGGAPASRLGPSPTSGRRPRAVANRAAA